MKHAASAVAGTVVGAVVALSGGQGAAAAVLNEDFESYSLTAGSGDSFTDQNGDWTVPFNTGSTANNIILDATVGNGTQVLQVQRVAAPGGNLAVRSIAFDAIEGEVLIELDVLPETSSGLRVIFSQDDNINRRGLDVDFSSAGAVRALSNAGFVPLEDAGGNDATYTANQWYRISALVRLDDPDPNFDVTVTNLTAGGVLVGSLSGQPTGGTAGDPINIGLVNLQTPETARFDNVSYLVPEPATIGLMLIGGSCLVGRRRQA